jgi:hypothetical protein
MAGLFSTEHGMAQVSFLRKSAQAVLVWFIE